MLHNSTNALNAFERHTLMGCLVNCLIKAVIKKYISASPGHERRMRWPSYWPPCRAEALRDWNERRVLGGEGEEACWPEPRVQAESEAGAGKWTQAFSRGPVCMARCGARDLNAQL